MVLIYKVGLVKTTKKLLLFISLVFFIGVASAQVAPTQEPDRPQPGLPEKTWPEASQLADLPEAKLQDIFDQQKEQWDELVTLYDDAMRKGEKNSYGNYITIFEYPEAIVQIIDDYEIHVQKHISKQKEPSPPHLWPSIVQSPVLLALRILFHGRGRNGPGVDNGWYGNHATRSGFQEIEDILSRRLLDKKALLDFKEFVENYDWDDPQVRIETGFAPNFVVADSSFTESVIQLIESAPVRDDYLRPPEIDKVSFFDALEEAGVHEKQIEILRLCSIRVLTDEIANRKDTLTPLFPRPTEVQEVLDTLARIKDKNPVLVGLSGVGKSTVISILAQKLVGDDIPKAAAFQSFKDAVIIETSPSKISTLARSDIPTAQALAFKNYFDNIRYAENHMEVPVIVFMDDMHTLGPGQQSALKAALSDSHLGTPIHFIGATTDTAFALMLQEDESWRRRLHPIQVDELSAEATVQLLKQQVPFIETAYDVKIHPSAVEAALQAAPDYSPSGLRPEGPYKLLQDVAVSHHRQQTTTPVKEQNVYLHVVEKLRLPLNPYNTSQFFEDLEALRSNLHEQVVDQQRMVNAMVDLWGEMFLGIGQRSHRVMLVAGPTGSGKTYAAQEFARLALGSTQRLLEVDATKFKTGSLSLNSFTGVPPGVLSSNKSAGQLPEFLEGRGRGVNVILINEIDKASPDFMEAIMEMLDTGRFQAQNGKTYFLGRSLIVFTTNKGHEYIYPRRAGAALSRNEIEKRVASITDASIRQWFMEPDDGSLYDTSKQLDPSVLNRINKAVPAAPPSREGAVSILQQELERINKDLSQRLKLQARVGPDVLEKFVDLVYHPEDGVRDLNSVLRAKITQAVKQAHVDELGIKKGGYIELKLQPSSSHNPEVNLIVATKKRSKSTLIKGPQQNIKNPLLFSRQRNRLKNMSFLLKQKVFGQDEAIEITARSIRTRSLNPNDPKPAVILYLGTTGTGKTQMAKSLAEVVYGHTNRYVQFDLGKVKWEGDLQNIFGASQGFVGSNKMSAFEKALNNFSEGAVLLFDEIGHMGTSLKNSPRHSGSNNKDDLLKVFYSLLDEGTWTNAHGKVYDLSKFIIIFTSSEVSDQFHNLPTDDLRAAVWKELKPAEKLRDILKSRHDWPEDLLGRIGNRIVLFEPLLEQSRVQVARKLVDEAIQGVRDQNGISTMIFNDQFYKTMIDSFFSHTQGARAMRDFSEGSLVDLIGEVLIDNYDELEKLKTATWKFNLHDNYTGLISYEGNLPPERQVTLSLEISFGRGRRRREWKRNITSEAVERKLVSARELYATAIHEAGHAVANVSAHTGEKVDFITVKAQGDFLGYARYKQVVPKTSTSREDAIYKIAQLLAGHKAQDLMNMPTDSGWRSDLEKARKLAANAIASSGLSDDSKTSLALPLRMDGSVNFNNSNVQKELRTLLKAGAEKAELLIQNNKELLNSVAQALLDQQYLSGEQFEKLQQQHEKTTGQARSTSKPAEITLNSTNTCVQYLSRTLSF